MSARSHLSSPEALDLVAALGIDYRKESNVFHHGRPETGLPFYDGWFHFKGRLLAGGDYQHNYLVRFTDHFS